jgi:hypothetical protein
MSGIRYAWCEELQDVLSAHDAKRAYFGLVPRPERLNFLCADEECRRLGTRVTGVNYRRLPEEEDQAVVVHYRELDPHRPGCEYAPDGEEVEARKEDDGAASRVRSPRSKGNDLFQIFDPGAGGAASESPTSTTPQLGAALAAGGGRAQPRGERTQEKGVSSTRFVEDLANLHQDAKANPELRARLDERIQVKGHAPRRLRDLFVHVADARIGTGGNIWWGGARLKRYGRGFRLSFMDRIADRRLSLYVSGADVDQYRFKGYLLELLDDAENRRYVTAYAWGQIQAGRDEDGADLKIERLHHLGLVLGPMKEPAHEG